MPDELQSIGVLVVDDDPNNVEILELYLEDEECTVFTANDGEEALEVLQQHKDEISVILLDRMMPKMDGMQFMEKFKTDPSISSIPVIMQTGAAQKDQVAAGIAAGVYYYLTKPYDQELMLSIVRAAVSNYDELTSIRRELVDYKSRLNMVKECYFEVETFDDINYLVTFLANFYPEPDRVVMGITELLRNAVEHGNLGITYEEKTELVLSNTWEQEIESRHELPENKNKKVLVHYIRDETNIVLYIKDEGEGFDWHSFLDIDPDRATHNHGRGIALAKMISFDDLEYKGCGNELMCSVSI